ncbi:MULTISPECIES: SDR family oxidoreductase [Prauserella salsuginis group]|uniref:SDR family oxidoreductase n=1 Tax=Prauserella salsuginis TaxID=387889 RepID=A0ABW6G1K1_9PSEU|nr:MULTISPECIES: SDR family oxidoreductase [Prauserella salsuginis group]MCR3722220.1 NAD(P)-dependent dehydrogenase, short-chain alcohol dehydrogenase family [Prauserella flava]MCR3736218.1 NAD(P)-dependent dehydrogenase, short-chain alcohol dehydrogenase family [Prauserella salsuginis]
MPEDVLVVTGVGGMGIAVARRLGPGRRVLLADVDASAVESATNRLLDEGYDAMSAEVDVSSQASVGALAERAAALGDVRTVVHTAGLSPVQAPVRAILDVDLLGVAYALDGFGAVIAPGGSGVVIASMAGHSNPGVPAADLRALATMPAAELAASPLLEEGSFAGPGVAYAFAKCVNLMQVQAASEAWGRRGARINSISPGIIATPMGKSELDSEHGARMRDAVAVSNAGRVGTAADVAEAAAFLTGSSAGFISGTDLLVDGGVTAVQHTRTG